MLTSDRLVLLLRERELVGIAVVGQVSRNDYDVGRGRVDLRDRGAEQLLPVAGAADVHVGELRDEHPAQSDS